MSTPAYVLYPHEEIAVEAHRRAPRLRALAGSTVALVDNDKPQAGVFLEELGAVLRRDHGVAATPMLRKSSAGRHVSEEQLATIREQAQAAVTGIGD